MVAACMAFQSCGKSGDDGSADGNGQGGGKQETAEEILKSSLIAAYTFEEGSAEDVSGNGHDGVVFGGASFISDTPSGGGSALFLNGIKEQLVNIPYNLFAGLEEYSICLWLKDFSMGSIVSGINSNFEPNCFPRLYLGDDGKLKFASNCRNVSNSPTFSFNSSSLQSGAWHHIAVTCSSGLNSSSTLNLYIDGTLTDSITSNWSDNTSYYVTKVQIGGNGDGFYPVFTSMKVDNVGFYSRALGAKAIRHLFDNKL